MVPIRPLRPRLTHLLRGVVLGLAVGCSGPRDATPLPEPPVLDPDKIGLTRGVSPTLEPAPFPITLSGMKSAASPGATVRVTNLDTTTPSVETQASSDGGFSLTISVTAGNELRLDAILPDGRRAEPVDWLVLPMSIEASTRFPCVTLVPGLELPFSAPGNETLSITNGCATAIDVSGARSRLGLTDFTLSTTLPLSIAPGSSAELGIGFAPSADGPREDVLFVSLANGGAPQRYPFTLYRP